MRVEGCELRVESLGLRVEGRESGVWGLGSRVAHRKNAATYKNPSGNEKR